MTDPVQKPSRKSRRASSSPRGKKAEEKVAPRPAENETPIPFAPPVITSSHPIAPAPDVQKDPSPEVVRVFEKLFRSFRLRMLERLGGKCEEAIARAEKEVRFLSPEFDYREMTDESAPVVLELIEQIVSSAPLLKRRKLRREAMLLISDLYHRQYALLEAHGVVDKVEEAYYRLKR